MRHLPMYALVALSFLACDAPADEPAVGAEAAETMPSPAAAAEAEIASESASEFVVYKSPTCGCCEGWIEHVEEAGYEVEAVDITGYDAMASQKREAGVPGDLGSCHTARVAGYTIEGHVPVEVIDRLIRDQPDIQGLAVPGMPIGSPGMEGPDPERYEVIAFTADGTRSVYATVEPNGDVTF